MVIEAVFETYWICEDNKITRALLSKAMALNLVMVIAANLITFNLQIEKLKAMNFDQRSKQ